MEYRLSYWLPFFTVLLFSQPALAQWIESNNGIYGGTITSLASHNGHLFAGTWGGVYYSNDNATSWQQRNSGLDNTFINAIATSGNGNVFIATQGGSRMFVSSEPFSYWTIVNSGLPNSPITTMSVIGNQIFGRTNEGLLYTWIDGNSAWTYVLTDFGSINSISSSNENIFVATDNGIYLSKDLGLNWSPMNNGLIEKSIYSISTVNDYVIAKSRIGLTFFSDDNGSTWSMLTLAEGGFKLSEFKGILYAANESRAYYSSNRGKTWETIRTLPGARDLIINGSTLIAGNIYGVFTSTDSFQWVISHDNKLTNSRIIGFATSQNYLFCATGKGDIFRSSNAGESWARISSALPLNEITAIGYFENTLLVALSNYGIYRSMNDGGSWSLAAGIAQITDFVQHKNQLFAGGAGGIHVSSDLGNTWRRLDNSPQSVRKVKLVDRKDTLYTSSPEYGVSFSVDGGRSWNFINDGLPLPIAKTMSLTAFQGVTLVGTENKIPIYVRETISSPWRGVSEGLTNTTLTTSFATDRHKLFAAGNGGVFISSTGFDWMSFYNEQLPPLNSLLGVESLIVHKNHLFAGTEAYGVWVSCIEPQRPNISVIGNAPNDSTLVSNSPEGNQWFLNDLPIPDAVHPTYKPSFSGKYSVKLILNDCESEMSEYVNLFIEEYPDAVIVMPNVFTPEGDSFNPVFMPNRYEHVSTAEIQIVDRGGKEIFRSDDLIKGWDGGNIHAGVYYYQIKYVGKNGTTGQVKGWVQLIR